MSFKRARFQDETYNFGVLLLWDISGPELRRFLGKKKYPKTERIGDDDWSGYALRYSTPDYDVHVIALRHWSGSPWDHSVLAHECLHITQKVLDETGMRLGKRTAEAYCYLHDSLIRRCLEHIKKGTKK